MSSIEAGTAAYESAMLAMLWLEATEALLEEEKRRIVGERERMRRIGEL